MTLRQTRRRFLTVSAAAIATAGTGPARAASSARWRGTALGAAVSLHLVGLSADAAAPLFVAVERELARLEGIFSLYRAASELSRLNAAGRLDAPSPDLLAVLSTSDQLHRATGGAFDPTVQPLFAAAARAAAEQRMPTEREINDARNPVGWDGVAFDAGSVRLARPGAALTLNGIAQGYITDRIAALLRDRGLADVLVDMGEIAAQGQGPDGGPWRAGIADPGGVLLKRLTLRDRALATSAPRGTVLDIAGRIGHIFDPASGREAEAAALVSISAPRAEVADGLSTALCAVPEDRRPAILHAFPGARIEIAT